METPSIPKLWNIFKSALIEKNTDDTVNLMGSMKRIGAFLFALCVVFIVLACLQPSFSLRIGTFVLNYEHTTYVMNDYLPTIKVLGSLFCVSVGIGETAKTIQNYHNVKYPTPPTTNTPQNNG